MTKTWKEQIKIRLVNIIQIGKLSKNENELTKKDHISIETCITKIDIIDQVTTSTRFTVLFNNHNQNSRNDTNIKYIPTSIKYAT